MWTFGFLLVRTPFSVIWLCLLGRWFKRGCATPSHPPIPLYQGHFLTPDLIIPSMSLSDNNPDDKYGRRDQWDPSDVVSNADPTSLQTTYPQPEGTQDFSTPSDQILGHPQPLTAAARPTSPPQTIRPSEIQAHQSGRGAVGVGPTKTTATPPGGYHAMKAGAGAQGDPRYWSDAEEGDVVKNREQYQQGKGHEKNEFDDDDDESTGRMRAGGGATGAHAGAKPKFTDKVFGTMEEVAGKMTRNAGMQERGEERKTGGF
ncbi:hypothetical protein JAAARDRAFT_30665 [Jaapia argillacea MUCL 33604]|uniref:Uncharacterized protein n=1 Tax=Jaapia argillacea MUCL 33604 TaxID=933084 RepID=A0A067Q6Z3_9AGAM|nr:hypothetical protein JAAARDRAFT_30665 [Jaapia argillacea MUCL 33604]